jgi:hypothetical protein
MAKAANLVNSKYSIKRSKPRAAGEPAPRYGYLLVLRALAEAAARLGDRPAALRVLTVLASYMDGRADRDPSCRVSRSTIADVLGIRRPTVQEHLSVLKDTGILDFEPTDGATTTFTFAAAFLEPLRTQKPRADAIEAGRAERRAKRRAEPKGATGAASTPSQDTSKARNGRQRSPTARREANGAALMTPAAMRALLVKGYGQEAAGRIIKDATGLAEDAGISMVSLLTRFGIQERTAKKQSWKMAELIDLADAVAGKLQAKATDGPYDFS